MDDIHSQAVSNTLSDQVAEELRALLARRRLSGRDLARLLNVSPSWVSYRLTGTTEITLNDLERIAALLGVDIVELLPTSTRSGRQPNRGLTARPTTAAGRTPRHNNRPTPTRPPTRTDPVAPQTDPRRPVRLSRPGGGSGT